MTDTHLLVLPETAVLDNLVARHLEECPHIRERVQIEIRGSHVGLLLRASNKQPNVKMKTVLPRSGKVTPPNKQNRFFLALLSRGAPLEKRT